MANHRKLVTSFNGVGTSHFLHQPKNKRVFVASVLKRKKDSIIVSFVGFDREGTEVYESDIVVFNQTPFIVSYDRLSCSYIIHNPNAVFPAMALVEAKKIGNFYSDMKHQLYWSFKEPRYKRLSNL